MRGLQTVAEMAELRTCRRPFRPLLAQRMDSSVPAVPLANRSPMTADHRSLFPKSYKALCPIGRWSIMQLKTNLIGSGSRRRRWTGQKRIRLGLSAAALRLVEFDLTKPLLLK